jgi:hypothetical protein
MTLLHGGVLWCLLLAVAFASDDPPKPDETKDKEEKAARMEHMKQAAKGDTSRWTRQRQVACVVDDCPCGG